jgi:hypothetical protein
MRDKCQSFGRFHRCRPLGRVDARAASMGTEPQRGRNPSKQNIYLQFGD